MSAKTRTVADPATTNLSPVVVLVDDNPDDRFMVARLVRREVPGAQIVEVASPEALERVLIQERLDVLVTDYELRWSNGLDVLGAVRQRRPGLPVIMFTGTGNEEVAVEAMKSGLDDYIIKSPDRLIRLTGSIRQSLERAKEREHAREVARRLKRLFAAVPLGLYRSTLDGELVEANPTLAAIAGFHRSEAILGRRLDDFVAGSEDTDSRRAALAESGSLKGFRYRLVRPDGSERWVEEDASVVHPVRGQPYYEGCVQDITERKETEERLVRASLYDAVTGLPNRVLFNERLASAWQRSLRRPEAIMGVLFIDLDHFKEVNDRYGHATGDEVLREAAQRIVSVLRPEDTLARLGGDEFAVLVEGLSGADEAFQVAERSRNALEEPLRVSDKEIAIGASVGVALNNPRHADAGGLLRDADAAMYRAKARGRSRSVVFEPSMRQPGKRHPGMDQELRRAIEEGQLEVHFQPVVELRTRKEQGVEALVRWRHPERGLLPAGSFVAAAEETGLIVAVDEFVQRSACQRVGAWNAEHDRHLALSINVSSRQLRRPGFVGVLQKMLAEAGLQPRLFSVEVAETPLLGDLEEARRILGGLRGIGVGVVLDDFGTSQVTLAQLKRLPLTGLKIDRPLVSGLSEDGPGVAIAEAVVGLGRGLGLTVIAEGVETAEQLAVLDRCGCDLAQGYLLGRPDLDLPD